MTLLCRSLSGKPYQIPVTPSTTVRDARLHLSQLLAVPFSELLLILHGTIMSDGVVLSALSLAPDDFLLVHTPRIVSRRVRHTIAAAPVIIPPVAADREPLLEMMEGNLSAPPPPPPRRDMPPPAPEPADMAGCDDHVLGRAGRDPKTDPSRDYVKRLLTTCNYDVGETVDSFLGIAVKEEQNKKKKLPKCPPAPSRPPPAQPPEPEIDYDAALRGFNFRDLVRYLKDMSNPEKAALLRLCQEFARISRHEIMQVFMFSEKTYECAAEILRH
jgi:hypothetical protein